MGNSIANAPQIAINKELFVHLPYDNSSTSLIDLWEALCAEI
jgi:hypothetical protein